MLLNRCILYSVAGLCPLHNYYRSVRIKLIMISVELFSSSTQELLQALFSFIPQLIVAAVIVLVGWFIGWLVERALRTLFRALPFFDEVLRNIGIEEVTKRAGLRVDLGKFFGVVFKVFIMLAFLVAALDVLGLTLVNEFLTRDVLGYIPDVVSAALVVIIGLIVAKFVSDLVSGGARAVKVEGRFAAKITKWSIVIFSALIALGELGIANEIVQSTVVGIIAAISLALGLAFGLGGQQTASDFLNRIRNDING